MDDILSLLAILGVFLALRGMVWLDKRWRLKKVAREEVVHEGREYPNNDRLVGVGFYHAAAGKWFHSPWNEFQEERGYYWDGEWHEFPDQRQVKASIPEPEEVARANREWRKAESDYIEHFGFGISDRLNSGS